MPAQRDQEAPEGDMIRHAGITDGAEKYGIIGPQLIEPILRHHATGLGVGLAAPVESAPLKRETIAARRRFQRLDAFRYDLAPDTVAGDESDPICPGHRLPPLWGERLAHSAGLATAPLSRRAAICSFSRCRWRAATGRPSSATRRHICR